MFYRILADAVLILHLAFILFVLFGGLLTLKNIRWGFAHLPAALWGVLIEFTGWICPLTPLENWLRLRAGSGVYHEGFIGHYLLPIIYPAGLTPKVQMVLGSVVLLINALVYSTAVYLNHRRSMFKARNDRKNSL